MRQFYILVCLFICSLQAQAQYQAFQEFDLKPGSSGSYPHCLSTLNGKLYFVAYTDTVTQQNALWSTDGTMAGTSVVKEGNFYTGWHNYKYFLTPFKGKLYFPAFDTGNYDVELWATDGTDTGTHLFKNLSNNSGLGSDPKRFFVSGDKMYFVAYSDASNLEELWVTDGTDTGTTVLTHSKYRGGTPVGFCSYNGKMYFIADDSIRHLQLWETDGTPAGTKLFKDVAAGASTPAYYSTPMVYNNKMYFTATTPGYGDELWVSDGTDTGTHMFADLNPGTAGGCYGAITTYNGRLYLIATDGVHGMELWSTDGTVSGTAMVADINPGMADGFTYYYPPCIVNGKLYFSGTDAYGTELFVTDGTAMGTRRLTDIVPGFGGSYPSHFIEFKGSLYFRAAHGFDNYHLYVSDGTVAGTHILEPANASASQSAGDYEGWTGYHVYNNKLYFPQTYTQNGGELWCLDTTSIKPLSVKQRTLSNVAFTIYPNPTHGSVTLSIPAEKLKNNNMITIYDATGRQVYSRNITTAATTLQLGHLPKGIYQAQLRQDDAVSTQRLLLQ